VKGVPGRGKAVLEAGGRVFGRKRASVPSGSGSWGWSSDRNPAGDSFECRGEAVRLYSS